MSDFLISNLLNHYRLDLNETIYTCIKQGKSINMIGLPAVGKLTYINFLIANRDHLLPDLKQVVFITLNLREYTGHNIGDFKSFVEGKISSGIFGKPPGSEVYLIIRFVEELDRKLLPEVWKYFLAARQDVLRIRFWFVSNRPLAELTTDAVVIGRLFTQEIYYRPSTLEEFKLEVEQYQKYLQLNFSAEQIDQLYALTGGHGGYLKACMTYENDLKLKIQPSDLFTRVNSGNLMPELTNKTQEILRVFKSEEINMTSPSKLILDLGLAKEEQGKFRPFSLILATFLQSHGGNKN